MNRRSFLAWLGIAPIAAPAAVKAAMAAAPSAQELAYDWQFTEYCGHDISYGPGVVRTSIPASSWRKINFHIPYNRHAATDEAVRLLSAANDHFDDDLPNVYDDPEEEL